VEVPRRRYKVYLAFYTSKHMVSLYTARVTRRPREKNNLRFSAGEAKIETRQDELGPGPTMAGAILIPILGNCPNEN